MAASDPSTWRLPRLRIDRDGVWHHEDEEVTHGGILATLWSSLQVDVQGHYIEIGPVRVPVEVEDAPYLVARIEREGAGLAATLGDGSREWIAPDGLWFGPGEIPYCRVKAGRFTARLSRAAAYQLLQHVEESASGSPSLVLGSARYSLPRRETGGGPAASGVRG
ncbi:MAG: DUF1285 domain-containing protein [Candidatus Rokubacteria bacterium]|nr:DUF1285 domain-containing protein [Candidatus Rokubacteria bacterium]